MNFLADESLDRPIVERLRQEGHHVLYVAELAPGISDDVVLKSANQQAAVVGLTVAEHLAELPRAFAVITAGAFVFAESASSSGSRTLRPLRARLNRRGYTQPLR
ncbi:MAG: DUF5615 family PIN-like protein [Armatimonadetes bacterium]|nr:DUF5615 family PIN-like protein [Armatimonadota bacterium]